MTLHMHWSMGGIHSTEQGAQLPCTMNAKSFVLHDKMPGVHEQGFKMRQKEKSKLTVKIFDKIFICQVFLQTANL